MSAKCVWEKHAQVFRYSRGPKEQVAEGKVALDKVGGVSRRPFLQHLMVGNCYVPHLAIIQYRLYEITLAVVLGMETEDVA